MSSIGSDVASVHNTFSSWDNCMAEGYCKWPVIIGIIIVSLIVISVVSCIARCLCFGLECCCGCLACCNACCPSPRGKSRGGGYQQPAPTPYQYQAPAAPPVYASSNQGYRGPQTATFDAPTKKRPNFNEDALPAMPSWDNAASRHVEEEVEMEKLESPSRTTQQDYNQHQHDALLAEPDLNEQLYGSAAGAGIAHSPGLQSATSPQQHPYAGDVGTLPASPYHDYTQHQQFVPSPYGSQRTGSTNAYPPTYHTYPTRAPSSSAYGFPETSAAAAAADYYPDDRSASIPPSYHTGDGPVSPISPTFAVAPSQQQQQFRRPYASQPPQQQRQQQPSQWQSQPYQSSTSPPPQQQPRQQPQQQWQAQPYQSSSSPPPQQQQQYPQRRPYPPPQPQQQRPYQQQQPPPPQQSQRAYAPYGGQQAPPSARYPAAGFGQGQQGQQRQQYDRQY